MLDLIAACWFGVIGACIGSFLNVVAYRMPRGMSVVWKPSHCTACGHDIRARDNVPVLGWLHLRGRCRDCGAPISPRYAIVEALMGLAFAMLAYVELLSGGANLPGGPLVANYGAAELIAHPNWQLIGLFVYHAILLSMLMAIVLIDADGSRTPKLIVAVAAVLIAIVSTHHAAWYPERAVPGSEIDLTPPLAALAGAASGAIPWLAALALARRGQRGEGSRELVNLAAALALVGGFLGLYPVVRIVIAQLVAIAVGRALRFPPLLALWPLTLLHIAAWRQIAQFATW